MIASIATHVQLGNESAMTARRAEYPRPNHCIVHVSDTHLIIGDESLYGGVDSTARLQQILSELTGSGVAIDAMVFTGDLTDQGDPAAYQTLRDMVEPVAADLGAELIWAMGNHDDRASFRVELLGEAPGTAPIDRVHDVDGLRIVNLDSTVPGKHHGELTDAQLDWLAEVLAAPAEHGTIVAMHHPPVPCVLDLAVVVELRDQQRLADVLRGTDVRAIIAGHLHYSTTATFAGIPVSVAAATCYNQDLNVPAGAMRGRDGGQGYNLIHVYDETVVHSAVPIGTFDTVGEYVSPEQTAARLTKAGVYIDESTRQSATTRV
ncbi:3',5'-cyclic AMP phosphodiesterase CpdA [Williamsia limnetica]|uniref:3',5'-cyclic AMP phosphodiesterase CpdA n=2 Tax=Williamsia limnetica TaxID=882452 RepID=A0A318RPG7_WILLI|nr:3',5'-cyclic AMP phosphodiesterase CpdA [Williamsia limnetica]